MKKKIMILLTVLALLLVMIPTAFAAEVVDSGTCGENVIWELTDDGLLTISGTGNMDNEYFTNPWYSLSQSVKTVIIKKGITHVGDYAFYRCNQLTEVTLPEGLESIGSNAFSYCEQLGKIIFPDSLDRIEVSAFDNCKELKTVSLPANISYIGPNVFSYSGLTSITLPSNLLSIESGTFSHCYNLINVTIPDNITSIGKYAFYRCDQLNTVYLPDNLVKIGSFAFYACPLTSITFPKSLNEIGYGIFGGTSISGESSMERNALVEKLIFAGDAPTYIDSPLPTLSPLQTAKCNAYYPSNNDTWTEEIRTRLSVGSDITWIPYCLHETTKLSNKTDPTCTTPGYTGDTVCTDCGEVLESGTEIDKLPHTEVTDKAVAATCSTPGKTEGKHCSVCNTVLVKQESVPATGHTFGPWTQIIAPTQTSEGMEQRKCACGETEQRPISKLPAAPEPTDPTIPESKPTFTDVDPGTFYEQAVEWAVENEVTKGRTETTFAPDEPCKRSEVVTFLHRAQGKPVPSTVQSVFTDVQIGQFYTDAVAWAAENEITIGMGDGTFGVDRACTRAQVVTFLWRAAGSPEPTSTKHPFTDLNPEDFYYDAVLWAVENDITSGMSATTFVPGGTCTRAQIVTFLHRIAG